MDVHMEGSRQFIVSFRFASEEEERSYDMRVLRQRGLGNKGSFRRRIEMRGDYGPLAESTGPRCPATRHTVELCRQDKAPSSAATLRTAPLYYDAILMSKELDQMKKIDKRTLTNQEERVGYSSAWLTILSRITRVLC